MSSDNVLQFPQRRAVGALTCPVDAEAFRSQNTIQLHPGKLNRWAMSVRVRPDAATAEVAEYVRRLFQEWAELFPGDIELRRVAVATPDEGLEALAGLRAPHRMRQPQRAVLVEFAYDGGAGRMPLPTFVQRRRERVDPLCPVLPFDASPWAALPPGGGAEVTVPVRAPNRGARDPWDLGLPALDVDALQDKIRAGIRRIVLVAAAVGSGVLLYQLMRREKRRRSA